MAGADLLRDDQGAAAMLQRVFARPLDRAADGLTLWVSGANFQIRVWRALLQLPFAGLISYSPAGCRLGRRVRQVPWAARWLATRSDSLFHAIACCANPVNSVPITGAGAKWRSAHGGQPMPRRMPGMMPPIDRWDENPGARAGSNQ